jgi:protein subunit release factor A
MGAGQSLLLARVHVDADTVMVDKLSLRDELDRLNAKYAELAKRKPPPTMKQLQDTVSATIAQIDAMSAFTLKDPGDPDSFSSIETFYAGDKEVAKLRKLLDRIKANLQSASFDEARDAPEIVQREQDREMQQPKCGNAHKLTNEYWTKLAKLWQRMVPQTTNKDVVTFVEIVTGAKPETIRSYLSRSSRCI